MQFQGKLMNQTSENSEKPNFKSNFDLFDPNSASQCFFREFHLYDVRHCRKLSLYAISEKIQYLERNSRK